MMTERDLQAFLIAKRAFLSRVESTNETTPDELYVIARETLILQGSNELCKLVMRVIDGGHHDLLKTLPHHNTHALRQEHATVPDLQPLCDQILQLYHENGVFESSLVRMALQLARSSGDFALLTTFSQALFSRALARVQRDEEDSAHLQDVLRVLVEGTAPGGRGNDCPPWVNAMLMEMFGAQWLPVLSKRLCKHGTVPTPRGTVEMLKLYWELAHRLLGVEGEMLTSHERSQTSLHSPVPTELAAIYASYFNQCIPTPQNGVGPLHRLYNELKSYVEGDEYAFDEAVLELRPEPGFQRRLLCCLCDDLGLVHAPKGDGTGPSSTSDAIMVELQEDTDAASLAELHEVLRVDASCLARSQWHRMLEPLPPYWEALAGFFSALPVSTRLQSVAAVLVSTRNVQPSVAWGLLLAGAVDRNDFSAFSGPIPLPLPSAVASAAAAAKAVGMTVPASSSSSASTSVYPSSSSSSSSSSSPSAEQGQICLALVKMAANRQDVYGMLETIHLAERWGVRIDARLWEIALQTAWASRELVPERAYRSSFSAVLRKIQGAEVTLDSDMTTTVTQFLVDTDPGGELTWRMLARLVKMDFEECTRVGCIALSHLILASVDSSTSSSTPSSPPSLPLLRMSEPLYESAKYLFMLPTDAHKIMAKVSAAGRRQLDEVFLRELQRLWLGFTAGKDDDRLALVALVEYGLVREDGCHHHHDEDDDDTHEATGQGTLVALDDEELRDALSLVVVQLGFHTAFYGRDSITACRLLHAWAEAQSLREFFAQNL